MLHVDLARQFHYKVNRDMGLICPSWLIFHHCIECYCSSWCFKHWCWPEESSLVWNSLILSSYIYLQNNAIWEGGSTARSYPQIGLLYYHILEYTCSKSTSGAMLIITMTSPPRFAVCPQNFANWFGSSHCRAMLYTFLQIKCSCLSIFIFTQPKILPVGAKHPHGWQQVLIHF